MPDPVTDALGTMTSDVAKACDAGTFSGLRASMIGQAMQALARAQARLAEHERRFPLQKEKRESGQPLDPVHQALVDDVKVWRDYMQGVNDMRFEPQACSRTAGLGDGSFYIPGTDTVLRIDGYVRYESNFIGDDAGLGVVVVPGDPFLLKYRDRLTSWTGGGNLHFDAGDMMRRIGFSYTHGSKRTSAEEPGGANAVGFISGDPADPGTNFGAFGAQATGHVSLDRFTLSYASLRAFNLDDGFGWGWPDEGMRESYKRLGWTATFDYTRLDYSGHLQRTPDPDNVYVDVNHRLYSYEFLFGPSFVGKRMIGDRFYVLGKADVQGGLRTSSLDTREITCFACGGATNTVDLSDSKTSFAWQMNAEVGVGTQIMPNLTAELTAGVGWGNYDTADVRRNPSDRGTQIGSATGYDWKISLQVRYAR